MKILPNHEILKATYPDKTGKAEKPVDNEFATILKETIDSSTKVDTQRQGPPMINNISSIECNTHFPVENNPMIDRAERFLDILDRYQKGLSNPRATLRDIYPLVQEMEREKQGLSPLLDSLPSGDGLKDILHKALITSSVEIIKFNRGYYVNS